MNDQGGYTLVELVLAVGMLVLFSGLAALSGTSFLASVRVSKETARLADSLSLAREGAIARYEKWIVEFPVAASGTNVVSNYVIKSCSLLTATFEPANCDPSHPDDWTIAPKGTQTAEIGVGFEILEPRLSPPAPVKLIFDGTGRYMGTADVDVKICVTARDSDGLVRCRDGGSSKKLRVRKSTGIVQSLS